MLQVLGTHCVLPFEKYPGKQLAHTELLVELQIAQPEMLHV